MQLGTKHLGEGREAFLGSTMMGRLCQKAHYTPIPPWAGTVCDCASGHVVHRQPVGAVGAIGVPGLAKVGATASCLFGCCCGLRPGHYW